MKKMRCILFALFFLTTLSQVFPQKGKEVIVGAGGAFIDVWIVHQNFYGKLPEVDYAPKLSGAYYATFGYSFTEQFSMLAELSFSGQGQKYEGKQTISGSTYEIERHIKLRYLNIPLFFKYTFGEGGTRFRVMGGPYLGLLLDANQEYLWDGDEILNNPLALFTPKGETENVYADYNGSIEERYGNTDYGIALDIGADIFATEKFFISAGLRMNYGLTDINTDPYRLDKFDGAAYEPSHNLFGGAYISLNYLIDVQSYKQRSF